MLSAFFWDPSREIFSFNLPILGRPILWYGLFFALGFFLGYFILVYSLNRYFLQHPFFVEKEILKKEKAAEYLCSLGFKKNGKESLLQFLNALLKKGDPLQKRYEIEKVLKESIIPLKNRGKILAEKALVYAVLGAIIGARLFDVLFYQDLASILKDPLSIIKVWEGGLSSHGGTFGALIALALFSKKERLFMPSLSFLGFLDFVCLPSAVIAGFIRIGNFFNQEILGTYTTLPFGVVFGHPVDGSFPIPRHPVQLYESLFYFSVAVVLFLFRKRPKEEQGKTVGLFLMLLFGFRFAIEFLKTEQSAWISPSFFLTMGQLLSMPVFLLGALFFFKAKKRIL